jgi:cell division protein FtsB
MSATDIVVFLLGAIGLIALGLRLDAARQRIEALDARLTRATRQIVKLRGRVANMDDELQEFIDQFEPTEIVYEPDEDADWWKGDGNG